MRNTPHQLRVLTVTSTRTPSGGTTAVRTPRGTVRGTFTVTAAEEVPGYGEAITATARVPHGADVGPADEVELLEPDHARVAGRYRVLGVRWNRDHLRLLLAGP